MEIKEGGAGLSRELEVQSRGRKPLENCGEGPPGVSCRARGLQHVPGHCCPRGMKALFGYYSEKRDRPNL